MIPLRLWCAQVGCKSICLPAARETIETWVHGFGFNFMEFDQESHTRRELRVLVFPGTRLLFRPTGVVCPSAGMKFWRTGGQNKMPC